MEVIITARNYKSNIYEHGQTIDEQLLSVHKDFIFQVVSIIAKDLDISNLKYIIVPEKFKEELSAFQNENHLPIEMTANEHGICKGKTLFLKDETGSAVIFLDKECLLCFIHDNYIPRGQDKRVENFIILNRNLWINILHHELCHVDERNKRKKIYWLQNRWINPAKPFDHFLDLSITLFEEYYACRKSSGTHFIFSLDTDNLVEEVKKIETEIMEKRTAYNHKKISFEFFYPYFINYSRLILTRISYALGNYYCLDDEKRAIQMKWLSEHLVGTNAGEILYKLDTSLNNLYTYYPEWEDEDVLRNLIDHVMDYYHLFNITLLSNGDFLYVKIPPLSDTNIEIG